jgi:RNA polymerase sigma-70 factor (ECF subfamily)
VARRIAGPSRDADDACQEAVIKIVRALPTFDGRAAFGTWAYRIATNAALDELRRRRRRPALHAVDRDDGRDADGPPEPVDPMGHRRVDAVADRMAIDEALDGLPDEFRTAVVLRDVLDLDYDEIAATLEIPIGTVKSRIARGRRLLVDHLGLDDAPLDDVTRDAGPVGNRAPDTERPTDPT